MALTLGAITLDALNSLYEPPAANAVYAQLRELLPYESNFPGCSGFFTKGSSSRGVLQLHAAVRVGPTGPAGVQEVRVGLTFPPSFPNQAVTVQVLLPESSSVGGVRIKHPYPVMGSDGLVQVECLTMLRGVERPYPLLDLLLALTEQFELELPYVAGNHPVVQQAPPGQADMARVLNKTTQNPQRTALIQEAAEKVVIDLNNKAGAYLETREQSLSYMQRLNESNRELDKAREVLTRNQAELEQYIPNMADVGALVRRLEQIPDSVEEHGRCLVAQSEKQERTVTLLAEIHATEDMLSLLEDGLKNDYFDVDEYVKLVSDVGRDQFMSRFLCQRVMPELIGGVTAPLHMPGGYSPSSGQSIPRPAVPQRLTPLAALRTEFPQADSQVIRDVLQNVDGDVANARRELRTLYGG